MGFEFSAGRSATGEEQDDISTECRGKVKKRVTIRVCSLKPQLLFSRSVTKHNGIASVQDRNRKYLPGRATAINC